MADMSTDGHTRPFPPLAGSEVETLLGFLAYTEDGWFPEVVGGEPVSEPWVSADMDANPDWEWSSAAEDSGDELRALWAERVERARSTVDGRLREGGADALGKTYAAWLGHVSLRWVILHMIEEYARHNGHADLIRESIDGETGE